MSFIPNTTPTPNWLYNGEMKKMNGTELKVVLAVTRATLGWEENHITGMRKQEDWISHTQLIEKTGNCSDAVSRAVDSCVKHGWIETRDKEGNLLKTKKDRQGKKVYYRLGSIFTDKLTSRKSEEVENFPEKSAELPAKNGITSSLTPDIQNKLLQKKIIQNNILSTSQKIDFEEFWKLYPKKENKKHCKEKWNRLSLDVQKLILEDLPRRKLGQKWKDGYVEMSTTYLNGERWEDEIQIKKSSVIKINKDGTYQN